MSIRSRLTAVALVLVLALPAHADGILNPGNGASGPCSTFGTAAGTCAQGNDVRLGAGAVTGAVKSNGSSGFGQAGCGDLSTNCPYGISGALNTSEGAATTIYLGSNSGPATQIGPAVAFSGNLQNLYVNLTTAPGGSVSTTVTLYVGALGSMSATTVTCTITGSATGCSDTTHTAAITAGQSWAIQLVTGSGAASTGGQNWAMQLVP